MLKSDQVSKTLELIAEVFPGSEVSYEVELSDKKILESQFCIFLAESDFVLHLKVLNQLKNLWECEDVTVRYDLDQDRFIYLAPYSSKENLQ